MREEGSDETHSRESQERGGGESNDPTNMSLRQKQIVAARMDEAGCTREQIRKAIDYKTDDGVRGRISEGKKLLAEMNDNIVTDYVWTGASGNITELPRYVGALECEGNFAVIGDFHIPTTQYKWLRDAVLPICERHLKPPRKLILAGDLFNMDALSEYKNITPPISLTTELTIGRAVMAQLLSVFDEVYYIMGNHDHRLHKVLDGDVSNELLRGIITPLRNRLQISPYKYMRVTSGGHQWHIAHQRNYSRNVLNVANKLANKHNMNVITWHEHHVGKGRDEWNRHTIVNGGGLHDPEMMAYVSVDDSTSPKMKNGFVLLIDGTAHLITPYPSMTNINRWLSEAGV